MDASDEPATRLSLPSEREILLTRTFRAPRALVFEAWVRPEHLARWWGPAGFTLAVCEIDLRPGGSYRVVMRAPDGQEFPTTGTYREIVPPERIVYTDRFDMPDMPALEALTTVTFTEESGETTLTVRASYETKEARDAMLRMQMLEGFSESFERLDQVLSEAAPTHPQE